MIDRRCRAVSVIAASVSAYVEVHAEQVMRIVGGLDRTEAFEVSGSVMSGHRDRRLSSTPEKLGKVMPVVHGSIASSKPFLVARLGGVGLLVPTSEYAESRVPITLPTAAGRGRRPRRAGPRERTRQRRARRARRRPTRRCDRGRREARCGRTRGRLTGLTYYPLARISGVAVRTTCRSWLSVSMRVSTAERRAIINTLTASTFPFLAFGDPVAAPERAARVVGTSPSGLR